MSTYEPDIVLAFLKALPQNVNNDNFETDWKTKVKERVDGWLDARGVTQSCNREQLQWAAEVVQYVSYLWKSVNTRGIGNPAGVLKDKIPILGPQFLPPSFLHVLRRDASPQIEPTIAYLKPLNVIHPLYYPEISTCPNCDGKDIKWDSWNATGHREVQGIDREETAIGYQLRCTDCKAKRGQQSSFAATSHKFWAHKEHWEIPRGIPHFTANGAVTRDLYNLIIETRPSTTSAGLAERIKQLHLLEYHKRKLEYLRYYETRKRANTLFSISLIPFSEPFKEDGYGDNPITDDRITSIFLSFNNETRRQESQEFLKTLIGIIISVDNSFKIGNKASVVDKGGTRLKVWKGGILSVINERNLIIAWRFCQSASPKELKVALDGLKARCKELGVPPPVIVVADNCCSVRSSIQASLPDADVLLDVWHFVARYTATIINGSQNPHRLEVGKDISRAIIKVPAHNGIPSTYWTREEQERLLINAYDKWAVYGGVWSAASAETHKMGLLHVRRGCLDRKIQDIRSDGSRIEGSHKGWSGIHRSFALGLELAEAFGHDHVLRRNLRIAHKEERPSPFVITTYGSHHTHLVNSNNLRWNAQVKRDKRDLGPNVLSYRATLPVVDSGERFGLVNPADAGLFGLETIKEEDEDGEDDAKGDRLLLSDEVDAHNLMEELQIDPALLDVPQHPQVPTLSTSTPSNPAAPPSSNFTRSSLPIDLTDISTNETTTSQTEPSSLVTISDPGPAPSSKRKSPHIDTSGLELLEPEAGSKRPRLDSDHRATMPMPVVSNFVNGGSTLSDSPSYDDQPTALQPPPTSIPPKVVKSTPIDPFKLPVAPHLAHLTPTERIFRRGTNVESRALTIKTKDEFLLFMDMRATRQWLSSNLSAANWITETADYNKQLKATTPSSNINEPLPIDKHPSALMAKLNAIEAAISKRLSNAQSPDYKNRHGDEKFWRKHCHAVPLIKGEDGDTRSEGKLTRRSPTCKRCKALMYPGGRENHRRGVCADGAQQKLDTKLEQNRDPPKGGVPGSFKELEWPQPLGVFTDGSIFHHEAFLIKIAEAYEKIVSEGEGVELAADLQAFVNLLARRTVVADDGSILFKLLDYSSTIPDDLIVKIGEWRHLRMDCLRAASSGSGVSSQSV